MNLSFLRPTRVFKGTIKTVANVPAWLGLSFLKETGVGLVQFLKPLYRPVKEKRRESFEQALQRLSLSEVDLAARYNNLKRQSWLFALLGLIILGYAIYLLIGLHLGAVILAILVSGLFFFKMSACRFWMFQIKERKLGCSIREWRTGKTEESNL